MKITFVHDEDMEQVGFYLDNKLVVSGYLYDMVNDRHTSRNKVDNLWKKLFGALGVDFADLELDYETVDMLMSDGKYPEDFMLLEKIADDPEAARRELRIAQLKREIDDLGDVEVDEKSVLDYEEPMTQRGGMVTFLN